MTHRALPILCLCAGLFLTGCVTESAVEATTETTDTTATASNQVEYSRTLQLLDKHVARYVFWKTSPGEEGSRERYIERSTCVQLVRLFQDQLLETAADPSDIGRQRIATMSLAFANDPDAVFVLTRLLDRNGDPRLMVNAAFALGELRSPSTPARPLIDMLSHPDRDVRNNTLLALRNSMEARRQTGADALGPTEKLEAMPIIEAALFEPEDPQIRGHAAACLGTIRDPRSVEPLVNLLPDPDPFVRTRTAIALGNIGDPSCMWDLVAVIDETPSGTPRGAVTTALEVLAGKSGRTVPPYIDQSERAWSSFLKERLGPGDYPDEK